MKWKFVMLFFKVFFIFWGIGFWKVCLIYVIIGFGIIVVVGKVEGFFFVFVEFELVDNGCLVEFMDISEKNNLRIVSVFDIGEKVF